MDTLNLTKKHFSSLELTKRLWPFISDRSKKFIYCLIFLMFLSSFSELISIGLLIPFLTLLIEPERFTKNEFINYFGFIKDFEHHEMIYLLTLFFVLAIAVAGIIRLALITCQTMIGNYIGKEISAKAFKNIIQQPFIYHAYKDSDEFISALIVKINSVINYFIISWLVMLSSFLFICIILVFLVYLKPLITLSVLLIISMFYLINVIYFKKKINKFGEDMAINQTRLSKIIQESLGSIRYIILGGLQTPYLDNFKKIDKDIKNSISYITIIAAIPRPIIETIGTIIIIILAYSFSKSGNGLISSIPILGVFALTAQRLLPIIQQSYIAWSSLSGSKKSLSDFLLVLELPKSQNLIRNQLSMPFTNLLEVKSINFRHLHERKFLFKNVNLEIKKGSCIGIIGRTGSGKSTFLDILMGLLEVEKGYLKCDDKLINKTNKNSYFSLFSHVPQSIFLLNASIKENIAFGTHPDNVDMKKVKEIAKLVEIHSEIMKNSKNYSTMVGEKGIRFSGGQRQRIGIARALYKNPEILILDEATSQLDEETEEKILSKLISKKFQKTLIIVSHRVSTLLNCDTIFEIKNGEINKINKSRLITKIKNETN